MPRTSVFMLRALVPAILFTASATVAPVAAQSAPREALVACEGHDDGDDCTLVIGSHPIAGTCMAPPNRPLACLPDRTGAPPPPSRD